MKRLLLVAVLALPGAALAQQPSVLVHTQPAQQGSLPEIVTAYGSAMPAPRGMMTLSLQQQGQVSSVDVTVGQSVRQNETLIDFTASAAERSTYDQAVAALSLANDQRTHALQLMAQHLATRDQLAQADKAVADARAALDALRREGAGEATRTITAPFDGVVSAIPVTQGQRVAAGAPLVTVTRQDGLVVTVGVEPGDRAKLQVGQPVALTPLTGGEPVQGSVARIDGMLNARTRKIDTDIAVSPGVVLAGEAFRADITVGQYAGWVMPHAAVLIDEHGAYVFQVNGAKAVRVNVDPLGTNGTTDVVRGPVNPSLPVVVAGNYQLEDGMAVREPAAKEAAR